MLSNPKLLVRWVYLEYDLGMIKDVYGFKNTLYGKALYSATLKSINIVKGQKKKYLNNRKIDEKEAMVYFVYEFTRLPLYKWRWFTHMHTMQTHWILTTWEKEHIPFIFPILENTDRYYIQVK